ALAKYRGKSAVAPTPAPSVEHETREQQTAVEENASRATGNLPATAPSGGSVPRRFSGGLPRWLLADASAEAEAGPSREVAGAGEEASAAGSVLAEPSQETAGNNVEAVRNDAELNEDQVAALASGFVEAKHEETQEEAEADAIVGGAEFDEEETEEQAEETTVAEVSELSEEDVEEVEAGRAANRAEFAADVAQEHAERDAAHGANEHGEHEQVEHEHIEMEHVEEEAISTASAASPQALREGTAAIEDD